jgi:hypothetical protein
LLVIVGHLFSCFGPKKFEVSTGLGNYELVHTELYNEVTYFEGNVIGCFQTMAVEEITLAIGVMKNFATTNWNRSLNKWPCSFRKNIFLTTLIFGITPRIKHLST